ncbi:MAG TPA: A/G-specific adenine glycosylase [Candidatus Binatia bacterium]|nr:A/G-specific adenine glycosylase [Candidatus Binatia bacterium]
MKRPPVVVKRPAASSAASAELRALRAAVLRWYRRNRRDLPWRRTRDPYAIWVSEIMLQQTRVETVIPYYERFLTRFPTVRALARAREEDVLAAWSGLGYYRRARGLHAAAAVMVREHGGRVPDDQESLRALPGVGAYTAAAIASVAHGMSAAAVDGNVIRVLARIAGLRGRRDDPVLRREVEGLATRLAEGVSPGDWTQALMELGALVCAPRAPRCDACPAAAPCLARRSGDAAAYPEPAKTASSLPTRRVVMLLARRGAKILLVNGEAGGSRGASDAKGWSLPMADTAAKAREGTAGTTPQGTEGAARAAAVRLSRTWTKGAPVTGPTRRFRHRTYAEDLHFEVWESLDPPSKGSAAAEARWVDPARLDELPLRGPTLKAVKGLRRRPERA